MSIDLEHALRRFKPAKHKAQLTPRRRDRQAELTRLPGGPPLALLLDTTVYINRAAGRLPAGVTDVIDHAFLFHCSVALAELATGVPMPTHPGLVGGRYATITARCLPQSQRAGLRPPMPRSGRRPV